MRSQAIAITLLLLTGLVPLHAAVTSSELNAVAAAPRPGMLPLDLPFQGEDGTTRPLKAWLGSTPSVWVLADYTCQTLCGPVISIVSGALARSGFRPGGDFRLIVIGLDPKDTASDARVLKRAQVGAGDLAAASTFLRGDASTIANLTGSLGFHYVYDDDHDQFAHPAAAFVVTADGRLSQALPGLAVDPENIRLALLSAGRGSIGTWTDHIRLLCYAYDPANGIYSVAIGRLLAVAGAATIAVLTLMIGTLLWHDHLGRRRQSAAPHRVAEEQTPTTGLFR